MRAGSARSNHQTTPSRAGALQGGLLFEYFTVGWNLLEALVGLMAGVAAGSIALIGFALDSIVEASSGGILIWRLRAESSGRHSAEEVERKAIRLVAFAFLALAGYVGLRAIGDLLQGSQPKESVTGIALAAVSLVVMPVLAYRKRVVARQLDSRALREESPRRRRSSTPELSGVDATCTSVLCRARVTFLE
jgi:divalent metal cation (Fe/Co/Zn/Cd) transporter